MERVLQRTIMLTVANGSSDLFDYPGFVLLDSEGDTLAKETVYYFGMAKGRNNIPWRSCPAWSSMATRPTVNCICGPASTPSRNANGR